MKRLALILLLLPIAYGFDDTLAQDAAKKVKQETKTNYDINGQPINQSMDAKGFHRVYGSVTFVAGAPDTVTLNDSPAEGKQDVSFIDSTTYSGRAWALNGESHRYWITPLTGLKFVVQTDNDTSTATVRFVVEGE